MNPMFSLPTTNADTIARTDLWFESLFHPGRGFAFPCDATGHVDIDVLSEGARRNYFLARMLIGHDYASPAVVCRGSREPVLA